MPDLRECRSCSRPAPRQDLRHPKLASQGTGRRNFGAEARSKRSCGCTSERREHRSYLCAAQAFGPVSSHRRSVAISPVTRCATWLCFCSADIRVRLPTRSETGNGRSGSCGSSALGCALALAFCIGRSLSTDVPRSSTRLTRQLGFTALEHARAARCSGCASHQIRTGRPPTTIAAAIISPTTTPASAPTQLLHRQLQVATKA